MVFSFGPLSDSFLSHLTCYPPFYFSESRCICLLWVLAPGICLPAFPQLLSSVSLSLSDTLCTFSCPMRHVVPILPPLSQFLFLPISRLLSPTLGPRCLEDLPISFSSSSSHCSSRSKMSSSYTPTQKQHKVEESMSEMWILAT